jgi:hypothetical protein
MKFLVATLAMLLAASAPVRAQEEKWDARLAAVSGDVTVIAADGSPEVSGEANMPLEEGDRVVVAEGGSAEVALDGGSLIALREHADFKLEKTSKGESSFFLAVGSLLAKIQKLGTQRLHVRTPTAVASVRGTEFGVEVDGDDSHVGVFDEGKVEVTGDKGGPPELLISNQETSVRKGAAPEHAAQLKRFMAHRRQMRGQMRSHLSALRTKWKTMAPEQRREMRKKFMERMREHRLKMIEKRGELKKKLSDKQKQAVERHQKNRAENMRKMEDRRNNINRGRRENR